MWRSYYKLSYEKFCKKQVQKMWPKSSKTLVKDKAPVKLQTWHFISKTKSSHRRCSLKKGVLKNFAKSTGKHLCWSLFFHNVTGQKAAALLKKRLQHRCFPVNFSKFLRNLFQRTHSGDCFCKSSLYGWSRSKWLLLNSNIAPLMFDLCSCLKI